MHSSKVLRFALALAIAASSAVVSAQILLPSTPKKGFGASISPAYDGWFNSPDGTHSFLIGYYNRNWTQELDIPIGPNNHFEPGDPDRGQPTHFYPNRNFGMFTITVPKNYPPTERLWWVLTVGGITQRVPFHMSAEYNMTPGTASEESPGGAYNKPAVLRFAENGAPIQGPYTATTKALPRTAKVGVPMPLDMWVEDDALYSSGTNAPMSETSKEPMAELVVGKYRGPGKVDIGKGHKEMTTLKGGKANQPYAGKASTTAMFDTPGEYMLHVTANDLSGPGGGATGCCWTTAILKVTVTP